ncbi:MAG: GWxTD domain-containing protein [Bacteroidales bacterium]|nr:GWxTD domain-containing protein [Bacteroidales bacterium]
MKRISLFVIILLSAIALAPATQSQNSKDKHLTAVFSYATFYHPQAGSYLETYISFDAWNLNFVKNADKYQAVVEVIVTVSQNDSLEIVKKYDLASPKADSQNPDKFNFIDVQRFAIANGIHTLKIQLRDVNSDDEPTLVEQQLAIYYDKKRPALSSVQMMANIKPTTSENILSRNGYDMEPYINDFLPEQINQINYYCELYNINRETRQQYIYVASYIETLETGKTIESTMTIKRHETDTLVPIFGTIDISDLPSGNYNLVVDIRNKQDDKMLFKKVPFFRSNPSVVNSQDNTKVSLTFAAEINDETQLNDYIEALAPIANEIERRDIYSLINRPGIEEKQIFLYRFWQRRHPLNPDGAWREYRQRVDYVNKNFSWPKTKGIQTDRGRVYLQYGPPDFVRDEKNFVSTRNLGGGVTIHQSNDPSERAVDLQNHTVAKQGQIFYLPYQLWRYNTLPGDDANRCFIFWDEFRSGFYKLLHSNAKGEVRDPLWEQRLSGQQLNEDMQGEVGDQFQRGY